MRDLFDQSADCPCSLEVVVENRNDLVWFDSDEHDGSFKTNFGPSHQSCRLATTLELADDLPSKNYHSHRRITAHKKG